MAANLNPVLEAAIGEAPNDDENNASDLSDLSLMSPEEQDSSERALELIAPFLIAMHRAGAMAKGRTGGVARAHDWASYFQLAIDIQRRPNENVQHWWERTAPRLAEAICLNYDYAPGGRPDGLSPMELGQVTFDIKKAFFKGGFYAWHMLLTSWPSCLVHLGLPSNWTHVDMGWPRELKEAYSRLREETPVDSVSRNVVEEPVDVEQRRRPGTFFDRELNAAPGMRVLSLELWETHLNELDTLLQKLPSKPDLRLGIRPQYEDTRGNAIPFISRFSRISFLALKNFDISRLHQALPPDAHTFLETLYVKAAPRVGTPLQLVQLAQILRTCKNLRVFELASGIDISHEFDDDVKKILAPSQGAIRSQLIRFCIATISSDLLDLLFRWFSFPVLEETEFVLKLGSQHGGRVAYRLPSVVKRWTEEAKRLVIRGRRDPGEEKVYRATIDHSSQVDNLRKRHILQCLWSPMTPGGRRRSRNARSGDLDHPFWPADLIVDIGNFFPAVTKVEFHGVLPSQKQAQSLLQHLSRISHLSFSGPIVKDMAEVLGKDRDICPELEEVLLWHNVPNPSDRQVDGLMVQAHKIVEIRQTMPHSKLRYVAVRIDSEVQVLMIDETVPALADDMAVALFSTREMHDEYDALTHRFFNAAYRWSLDEMDRKLMYTATGS
ncbi:hypothetical protein SISNIDRAFT_488084 [Sistotremastrum niveocremeum HHB9708]|uniref:Uncharacterized protein n=1 Tax=Sistotremastrum niveocremeum HHB9708 TaxID=1314777 RepID=A0A164RQU7_9AGAM|nr:hypothetical protein SISNIDRAFT_488084 [Sistotremastrum niveocremeum HHB9708]